MAIQHSDNTNGIHGALVVAEGHHSSRPILSLHDCWALLLSRFKESTKALKTRFDDYKKTTTKLNLQTDDWSDSIFLDSYEKLLMLTTEFEMEFHASRGDSDSASIPLWSKPLEIWQIEERYRNLLQLQGFLKSMYERATPSYDQSKAAWFFDPSYYQSDGINYDRFASPDVRDCEARLLEALKLGSKKQLSLLLTSSGMAAFTVLQQYVVQQLNPGDVVAVSPYIYFESFQPLRSLKTIRFVNAKSFTPEDIIAAAEENSARAVFLDPMVNTVGLETIDLRQFAQTVSNRPGWEDRLVVIDGTLVSGGMEVYDWFEGPHCPTVLYYESAHKYIQMGMDLVMCGYVVVPEQLSEAMMVIRQVTGSVLYSRMANLLPAIDSSIHHSRMACLTTNAERLHNLLQSKSGDMAEITFPKHWSELGWRHGGNVVTVNFFGEGLNKKHNLERCCGMILRAAEEIGVPITKGAGLGFSVTRIYESSAFLKNVDPYLRISVGVEAAHVELVAQAILQGMEQYCRSATRVNLDVRQRFYDVSFYEAIAIAADIRRRYIQERVVFIPGTRLIPILKAFGAQQEDFEALHSVSDHLGKDPTVDYRTIKNGRFSFDFGEKTIRRLEKQLFTLTVGEGYKRHDSGIARDFPEVTGDLQYNTVVQALMVFKAFIMNEVVVEPREYLDYSSPYWICNLFNVRTFTEKDILGEITLEGVHSDGGDHTMTTFLGCTNMRSDSGVTFVHDQKETTGIPVHQTQSILVKHRLQHRHFLDTILLVDNEAKHSLTPLYPIDASQRATRDMLVLITRKPRLPGHASEMVDQLASHTTLPLQIPFWLPS